MSDLVLDGAVALVTGASSGIGAATARRLAREGAAVALVARRCDRLDQVVEDIQVAGGHAVAMDTDITVPECAYDAVQGTMERFGRLDVLVNNAEIMLLNSALHADVEDWARMIALNVAAMLRVTHEAGPPHPRVERDSDRIGEGRTAMRTETAAAGPVRLRSRTGVALITATVLASMAGFLDASVVNVAIEFAYRNRRVSVVSG